MNKFKMYIYKIIFDFLKPVFHAYVADETNRQLKIYYESTRNEILQLKPVLLAYVVDETNRQFRSNFEATRNKLLQEFRAEFRAVQSVQNDSGKSEKLEEAKA